MIAWLRELAELVLPPLCCACAAPAVGRAALCRRCRRRLGPPPDGATPAGLASCNAAVAYRGEAARWIHRFKYPRPGLAGLDPAAQGVCHALAREAAAGGAARAVELVVPVPLHPGRLRARGFNPAALLAGSVARELRAPRDPSAAARVRATASQTGLGRRARRRNVAGAFRAVPERVEGRRLCLVDDVVTTGSTLSELARELRRAGALEVHAVCIARTPVDPAPGAATTAPAPGPS
jgi:ComF family protein